MGNLAQGAAGSRPAGQVPAGLRVHVGRGGGLEARILRAGPRRRCAGGKTDGERAGASQRKLEDMDMEDLPKST